ncbi:MAG: formylglycine-generating enzyme family protein [Kiritimatiellae bacterium]|nr:formylglycine-generating enzyme family protein [Kiritimatiellia bacterium]
MTKWCSAALKIVAAAVAGCGPAKPPVLVKIPAGEYRLGSREAGPENPPHIVVLSEFHLGAFEVTVEEFARFLNATGTRPQQMPHPDLLCERGRWRPAAGRARHPIASVTAAEAEAYCRWLSREIGRLCRLPTADEWEAAARGGIHGAAWPWGWGPPRGRMAWNLAGTRPVGRYPPNPFGLYDMAGNVFEWCADRLPAGRLALGGAWSERSPRACAVFRRPVFRSDYSGPDVGFRVAVELGAGSTSARCSSGISAASCRR